jgi:hypothetical protein
MMNSFFARMGHPDARWSVVSCSLHSRQILPLLLLLLILLALGYGLDDRGPSVRVPAGAGNFSLHHCVQNSSGAHPASYSMGNNGSYPKGKRPGREADHSPPPSAEATPPLPHYVFMAWCLVKQGTTTLCWEFFSSPPRPDRLWGPPSLLSSEYQGSFAGVKLPEREGDHSLPSSAEVKE